MRVTALITLIIVFGTGPNSTQAQDNRPPHEVETGLAWDAFEAQDYNGALEHAQEVIEEFGPHARRMQRDLAEQMAVIPVGRVPEDEQMAVFQQGVLNDVAAAWFISGRCLAKLGRLEEASQAFAEAGELTYARVFDPAQDLFWAPAPISRRCAEDPLLADKAPHEIFTLDAWNALNSRNYEAAIEHADQCISQFLPIAESMQDELTQANAEFGEGAVSESESVRIHQNGLLNDVCSCLFIKGKAYEALRDRDGAVTAYHKASTLTHARCWDPNGWFWNPSTTAADRLEVLQ